LEALGADPLAALVGVANTLPLVVGVTKRPPTDGAVVVTPTVRHEVNLRGVESLTVIERNKASDTMDESRTSLPTLPLPSVCATLCDLVGKWECFHRSP
jgi:hypothetical protein